MKSAAVIVVLCAAAAAAPPPRIELNLSPLARKHSSSVYRSRDSYFGATAEADASYASDGAQGSQEVYSRQDWVQSCQVLASPADASSNPNCPLPTAMAWDHLERNITDQVQRTIYYVDQDNVPCTADGSASHPCEVQESEIKYGTRGTYLFKYDVEDTSGNKAEQVVFVLEIDDRCASCQPTITICGDPSESWEAATDTKLCTTATAHDPIPDQDVTDRLEYAVHVVTQNTFGDEHTGPEQCRSYVNDTTCADTYLTTAITSGPNPTYYKVKFYVCDRAGMYGVGDADNCVEAEKHITVSDNTSPIITVLGWGDSSGTPLVWECNEDTAIAASTCSKADDGDPTQSGYAGACWHGRLSGDRDACTSAENGALDGSGCWGKNSTQCAADAACSWASHTFHDSGAYSDDGAVVYDSLDTGALSGSLAYTATTTPSAVNTAQIGSYTITYTAQDTAQNQATPKTRVVEVKDTLAPTVVLDGFEFVQDIHDDFPHSLHNSTTVHYANESNSLFVEPSWTCHDQCDSRTDLMKQTPQWDQPWNDRVLGDYYRTYTCEDASGNSHSAVRKFTVKDQTAPRITLLGPASQTIEATRDAEYTDMGATCHDYVDGVLSHGVEVSGQIVNTRLPGTYTIQYDCRDYSNNSAVPLHRVVKIVDTTCPQLTMKGTSPVYIESGFEYVDPNATAYDTLDGDITDRVYSDGNTIDVANAFHTSRSCREILTAGAAQSQALTSGMYFITVYRQTTASYHRKLVHCDMETNGPSGSPVGYTYASCGSTATPCQSVVPYGSDQGSCADFGMQMANFVNKSASCEWIKARYGNDFPADFDCASPSTTETSVNYLCGTNDELARNPTFAAHRNSALTDHLFQPHQKLVSEAEAGVYVIYFHVTDSAGNPECHTPSRTVIVKDTLPPVITLHLKNDANQYEQIHMSDADKRGLHDVANPAATVADNPHLAPGYNAGASTANAFPTGPSDPARFPNDHPGYMAEQAAAAPATAWVAGAVASAVAGLALLGLSRRKQQQATSVPV